MKCEEEIRDEIEIAIGTRNNYRKFYDEKKITKEVFSIKLADLNDTIDTLKWVLDENDRDEYCLLVRGINGIL
ncbi:MAG: hypothetical protein E7C47_10330 [Veillonella sp.]|uniref:hypothetical protein n=1 Tax=Veillonella sp. TaxID=1926307 RepID=UPI00290006AE|nr:hypothetical protein [Veillonella sp.]MDU2702521.1 hypothetical protein [Veillonella sp.]